MSNVHPSSKNWAEGPSSSTAPVGRLLGQTSGYPTAYCPEVLEPIARTRGRQSLLGDAAWPYFGEDVWTAYEVAFLGPDGRPHVGAAQLHVPCHSSHIVESKSLKLYLFGLNNTVFANRQAYADCVCRDVGRAVGAEVHWTWLDAHAPGVLPQPVGGRSIDDAPFEKKSLAEATGALKSHGPVVTERLYSELLRSLCPVTAQPDWATLVVESTGPALDAASLLAYVVAYRDHQGFHEQCVERIFLDLWRRCDLTALTVYARYTRRGGIDINPLRSTHEALPSMTRTWRQ